MNKKFYLPILVLAVLAGFSSCSSKLKPLASDYIKATPQPLEAVAGKVPVTINATFPAKWFNKNATVEVIPVLRYTGGEAWGSTYVFQGEKVSGNGQVVNEKNGGNVTMTSSFNYVPDMQKAELYLTFSAKIKNKNVDLPDVKIGDGVLATSALADAGFENPAIAEDAFQRIIKQKYDADIMFLIQQAELRSTELRKNEISDWKGIVESAHITPNQNVEVEISAYASPDGGIELNEKLAAQREKNTNRYIANELKKSSVDAPVLARYTAQDWDGFKELVQKSNIQDKDLILRVLSSYNDPEEREKQIKNISSVFSVLADEILPQLRRSRLTANVEIIGKSDEEINALASSSPRSLNVEELLYAATLVNTPQAKSNIYSYATQIYPNDYRGFNNLGVLAYEEGNYPNAAQYFATAQGLAGVDAPELSYNQALIALKSGDKDKAQQLFGKASGVKELNNGMALLAIESGDYSKATGLYGNTANNNAAIAQILTKDYNKALATLNGVQAPDAITYYLKAIVGARTNSVNDVISNLKQSIALDPSLAYKASNDLEFAKLAANSEFLQLVK